MHKFCACFISFLNNICTVHLVRSTGYVYVELGILVHDVVPLGGGVFDGGHVVPAYPITREIHPGAWAMESHVTRALCTN